MVHCFSPELLIKTRCCNVRTQLHYLLFKMTTALMLAFLLLMWTFLKIIFYINQATTTHQLNY